MDQTDRGLEAVLRAAVFAAERHAPQRRKGTAAEPYVNHLLEVACMVASVADQGDINVVIAAVLHDSIEDTPTSKAELIERFGADVAALVEEVTDNKSLPKAERKRLQVENAPKKTRRAQMIKLADKISNLRAILVSPPVNWDLDRQREYFEWAQRVIGGLTAPHPALKTRFDEAVRQFEESLSVGKLSEKK